MSIKSPRQTNKIVETSFKFRRAVESWTDSEACMSYPRVILIGGAPMSGKTAVAHMLAATLGYGCLSTDDLGAAIRAVTTKDSVDVAWTGRGGERRA